MPGNALLLGGLGLISIASGLVCAVLGMRGRPVGGHPHCRKCGYDLFGLPEVTTRCPECGVSLAAPQSRRTGALRRNRLLIAVGLLLVVSGCLTAGYHTKQWATNFNWASLKPLWWLERELVSTAVPTRQSAETELSRRLASGRLTSRDAARIAMLAPLPINRPTTISPFVAATTLVPSVWVDCAIAARTAGTLSDSDWDTLCRRLAPLTLAARTPVRRGDAIAFRIDPQLHGAASRDVTSIDLHVESTAVDGIAANSDDVRYDQRIIPDWAVQGGGDASGAATLSPQQWATSLSEGPHTLTCLVSVQLSLMPSGASLTKPSPCTWQRTITLTAPFTVVSADTPTVQLIVDPTMRDAVRRCLIPRKDDSKDYPNLPRLGQEHGRAPMDMAFDVYLRNGKREVPLGPAVIKAGSSATYLHTLPPDADLRTCDVIFRPSNAQAARHFGMTRIWGEPITFPASTRPSQPATAP